MSDLISRQAAIDAFEKELCGNAREYAVGFNGAKKILGNVPSAPRWIPVSERLPEKNSDYLVTEIDHITSERLVDIAYYGDFICTNNGFYKANDIVAWMPLPDPWRGEEG